jgi:hypothetical protein
MEKDNMESVLSYDLTIYDAYSCKRDMIREKFKVNSYKDIYYFKLVQATDNLTGRDDKLNILHFCKLPQSFYEFLDAFYKYPHPYVQVVDCNSLQFYINAQNKQLLQRNSLEQLMYFIPIATFHHHITKWDDSEYLHVLLFVNIVDFNIKPEQDQTYIVIKIPCAHILTQNEILDYLQNLTTSTAGDDLSKLRKIEFQPLSSCLQQLIKSCDLF